MKNLDFISMILVWDMMSVLIQIKFLPVYPTWNKYKGDTIFPDFQSIDLASIMQTIALSNLKYNLLPVIIFDYLHFVNIILTLILPTYPVHHLNQIKQQKIIYIIYSQC